VQFAKSTAVIQIEIENPSEKKADGFFLAEDRSTTSQKSCGNAQDKRGYKFHHSLK